MTNDIVKHQLECFEKQKDERHKLREDMMKSITVLDDKIDNHRELTEKQIKKIEIANSTYNENLKSMQKDIKTMDKKLDWLISKFDRFIEIVGDTYATKEELKETNSKVWKLDKMLFWLGKWVVIWLSGTVVSLIVYIYLNDLWK